jgi:transposase, IS5 family
LIATGVTALSGAFGNTIERFHTDAGYRGHNAPREYKFEVHTAKQKRRVTPQVKRL